MEKEKIIKELTTKVCGGFCNTCSEALQACEFALAIHEIIPEGAVVLTKEELAQRNKEIKELKIANNNLIFQLQCHDDEVIRLGKENGKLRFERDFAQKIVSKKTAKEILDEVSKHYGGGWLVELYKKYGVEV